MKTGLVGSLLLVVALGTAAQADDAPLPEVDSVNDYLRSLLAANQGTIRIGGMEVQVNVVPNYFDYLVTRDFLALAGDGSSDATVRKESGRLSKKHAKHRGKPAVLVRFHHGGCKIPQGRDRSGDFYAFETKLLKKIKIEQVGRGTARVKVAKREGRIQVKEYKIFSDAAGTSKGGAVRKQTWSVMPKDYAIDLVLKKALHAKTKKLRVKVLGLVHIHGSGITQDQMDLGRGARIQLDRGGDGVEFEVPLEAPSLPNDLAAVVAGK